MANFWRDHPEYTGFVSDADQRPDAGRPEDRKSVV